MSTRKPYPYHMLVDPERAARARREAVLEVDRGATKAHVARQNGVSRQTVDAWCKLADPETREVPQKPDGPKRRVPLDVLALKVAPQLDKGPRACGFDADAWTARLASRLIERETGVAYAPGYTARLLARMGFSPQKPERRARERDEEAITAWRREVPPELEKKGG